MIEVLNYHNCIRWYFYMVNAKEKYGISNRTAILLFVQMVFVKLGLIAQTLLLVIIIINKLSVYMMISAIAMILAHLAITIYSYFTRNRGKFHYYIAFGYFLLAILINLILPFRDMTQKILLTLLFGAMTAFLFRQEDYKVTNVLILVSLALAVGFSVYSAVTANPNSLGEPGSGNKELLEMIMYVSIFAPVVMVATFGIAYQAKYEKKKNLEQKQEEPAPQE